MIRHLCIKTRVVSQLNAKTIQKSLGYRHFEINSRLRYFKPASSKTEKTFATEISSSLNKQEKSISSKFFYDIKGSMLFDKICKLPEYYLTRTEKELLKKIGNDLFPMYDHPGNDSKQKKESYKT